MNMTLDQIWQALQILVSLTGFGGIAFTLGRMFGRIDNLERGQSAIQEALFKADDGRGTFLRRAEAEIMLKSANDQHESFDRRLEEFNHRLGSLEARR